MGARAYIMLTISGSKLKRLFIKANDQVESISLHNAPNLYEVSIAFDELAIGLNYDPVFDLEKFVGSLPKIKILRLNGKFLQLFIENLEMSLLLTLQSLKVLEFKDVNFMDFIQIFGVVCLLKCAPNLQELYIKAHIIILSDLVSSYLRELSRSNFISLHKLRLAKLTKISNFVAEFEFIRFLLFSSSSLVTVTIVEHPKLKAEKALDLARELLKIKPSSGVCINLLRENKT
ncbi:hypothetical protein P3S67_030213 [Capsicum chacoense]